MSVAKVLWVEDDLENMRLFQKTIEADGMIKLVHFRDATRACEYLDANIEDLAAAILDIESYAAPDSTEETAGSFFRVSNKLNKLSARNPIEYFAFTGKGKYLNDSSFSNSYGCPIYDKNFQVDEAISFLEEIVAKHSSYAIETKYSKAFAIFDCVMQNEPVLDYSLKNKLFDLVKAWDDYSLRNSGLFHGLIRPIAEKLLMKLVDIGVIDETLTKWNQRSANIDSKSRKHPEDIPSYIARSIHTIFDVCPEGIHDCPLFDAVNKGETPYLLQSLTMELFNLMAWFPHFVKKFPNREQNIEYFKIEPKYK